MSAAALSRSTSSASVYLIVPIVLLFGLFVVAILRSPSLISSSGLGSAVIVAAPLILATYALTAVVMAGRAGVDLSIGPLIGFINVTLVELHGAGALTSVADFFVYALAVGIAYQLIQGLIIVFVRIQPIVVSLSGFLTLAGLNLIILPRPGGSAPEWMASWGLGTSIWSPVLAILIVATLAWFAFQRSAFYDHLRLMGSDERTAYSAGVNIIAVRLGAHAIAGIYAGLAALTFTSLIGSGDPTQGSTYTLMAVTALVLGGTSLGGGRGSILGSLFGALNIYLVTYVLATFNFGKVQSFVTQLSYGVILVIALLLTLFIPQIQAQIRRVSPLLVFVVLGLAATGVTLYALDKIIAPSASTLASGAGGVTSLSASGGQASGVQSLSAQSLSAQSLSAQSSAQSLSAQSAQSLSAQSAQSLSAQSLSSASSLSAAAQAEPETGGSSVMIAITLLLAGALLLYLLYRHLSVATVVLVGVLALMILGYGAYEPGGADEAASVARIAVPSVLAVEGPAGAAIDAGAAEAGGSLVASPLVSSTLFVVGALLFGTFLILFTIPRVASGVGARVLLSVLAVSLVVAALLIYEDDAVAGGARWTSSALIALVVGLLLFVMTLPKVQARIRHGSLVMLALLSSVVLGALLFAGSPGGEAVTLAAVPERQASAQPLEPAILTPIFYSATTSILAVAGLFFLLMIPPVRRFLVRNAAFDKSMLGLSYVSVFVAAFACLIVGAVFYQAGIPLWKFIVTIVAALIGARIISHLLKEMRRRRAEVAR